MNDKERVEILKSYIQRVTDGEPMESVQNDFKENFASVPAKDIAKAEQLMMQEGVPFENIQKLCDIHSVLFHDMTDEERMERLKEEMEAHKQSNMIIKEEKPIQNVDDKVSEKTIEFKNEIGHPLNILKKENIAIKKLVSIILSKLEDNSVKDIVNDLKTLSDISKHYGKKDELIFPILKDKYDYPGPSDVMWAVEDEIRNDLRFIIDVPDNQEEKLDKVLKRINEMVYKEENILFPLCVENFSEDEWIQIYEDMKLYGPCLIDTLPVWDKYTTKEESFDVNNDIITLPGGTLTLEQLRAILNLIPMEITIIDAEDINRFFDEAPDKIFLRPKMALNREVYSCHPPRVTKIVKRLIEDFKAGNRDSMHILGSSNGRRNLTNYYALRNSNGDYIGTMEAVLPLDNLLKMDLENGKGPVEF